MFLLPKLNYSRFAQLDMVRSLCVQCPKTRDFCDLLCQICIQGSSPNQGAGTGCCAGSTAAGHAVQRIPSGGHGLLRRLLRRWTRRKAHLAHAGALPRLRDVCCGQARAQCEGPPRCLPWQTVLPPPGGGMRRVLCISIAVTGRKSPGAAAESAGPKGQDPRAPPRLRVGRAPGQLAIATVM